MCRELRSTQLHVESLLQGLLGEEAAKQLQPLEAQLTRLSLPEGCNVSTVAARAAKVDQL
jgi:hypothetical protein